MLANFQQGDLYEDKNKIDFSDTSKIMVRSLA